eukprot:EG_transcript_16559
MSSEVTFTVKFPQNAPPTLTPVALKLLNKRKEAENAPSRPQSQQHYEEWPSRKQGMPTRQPNTFRQPPVQSDRMLQDREENHFPVQRVERARSSRATFPIRQAGPSEWQPPRRPRYDDQNGYLSDGDVPLTRPNPRTGSFLLFLLAARFLLAISFVCTLPMWLIDEHRLNSNDNGPS